MKLASSETANCNIHIQKQKQIPSFKNLLVCPSRKVNILVQKKQILNRLFIFITFLTSHLSDGSSKAIIHTLELQTGSTRVVTLTGGILTFQTSSDSVGKTERVLRFILCSPSLNPYHLLSLSSFHIFRWNVRFM